MTQSRVKNMKKYEQSFLLPRLEQCSEVERGDVGGYGSIVDISGYLGSNLHWPGVGLRARHGRNEMNPGSVCGMEKQKGLVLPFKVESLGGARPPKRSDSAVYPGRQGWENLTKILCSTAWCWKNAPERQTKSSTGKSQTWRILEDGKKGWLLAVCTD